jgi:hypothetical protein
MSDVSAVVLTVGEQTTNRALASLKAQSLPVEDVVIVEGVRPFHRAFNSGVEQVTTPFFVQVDADMVLDPDCVEVLRGAMSPTVGIAVGALRDPLMGTVAGVKAFRRSCLEAVRLRDTIGPEIEFSLALGRLGWLTQYLYRDLQSGRHPTLGSHRPDYTVEYVFGTYYLLGRLYGHREDTGALRWRFTQLRRSAHPMAPVARLAMAHGIFGCETRDIAKPPPSPADSTFLRRLTEMPPDASVMPRQVLPPMALATEALFEAFHELGASLRVASHIRVRACLRALGEADHPSSLLAEVALGSGALARSSGPARNGMPATFERLAEAWAVDGRSNIGSGRSSESARRNRVPGRPPV